MHPLRLNIDQRVWQNEILKVDRSSVQRPVLNLNVLVKDGFAYERQILSSEALSHKYKFLALTIRKLLVESFEKS